MDDEEEKQNVSIVGLTKYEISKLKSQLRILRQKLKLSNVADVDTESMTDDQFFDYVSKHGMLPFKIRRTIPGTAEHDPTILEIDPNDLFLPLA